MSGSTEVFIGRQPILDREQRIFGYELLFRASGDATVAQFRDATVASSRVIVDTFTSMGCEAVLGSQLGFLNVTGDMLLSELVEAIPREQVVLEILESAKVDDALVARCRELKQAGYRLAVDDYVGEEDREPLFEYVDFVKLDVLRIPRLSLKRVLKQLRRWPVRTLAEKVEEREAFELYHKIGFELFQGYYFARPVVLRGRSLDPSHAVMLRLLDQLSRDADLHELEESFKKHVDLGMNLLRLVNSAALARSSRIATVSQALVYVGRGQLRRWLLLLLFAGKHAEGLRSPLFEAAALRGRLMEQLAQRRARTGDDEFEDRAFLAGMLSLGDTLLGIPRDELVAGLNLEGSLGEALLHGSGDLGALLSLTEHVERGEFRTVEGMLSHQGLTADALRAAQIEAFTWVHGLQQAPFDAA